MYWICDHPGATESAACSWHADRRGNWPWGRRYQGGRGGQPVLGIREPPERRKRVG